MGGSSAAGEPSWWPQFSVRRPRASPHKVSRRQPPARIRRVSWAATRAHRRTQDLHGGAAFIVRRGATTGCKDENTILSVQCSSRIQNPYFVAKEASAAKKPRVAIRVGPCPTRLGRQSQLITLGRMSTGLVFCLADALNSAEHDRRRDMSYQLRGAVANVVGIVWRNLRYDEVI